MLQTNTTSPQNAHQRIAIPIAKIAAFCFCFFSISSSSYALEPYYHLLDYPDYYAAFAPQLKGRIQKDAKDVSKHFKFKPRHAMTVCSNYWIQKCRALEKRGEICQNDRTKQKPSFRLGSKTETIFTKASAVYSYCAGAMKKLASIPADIFL